MIAFIGLIKISCNVSGVMIFFQGINPTKALAHVLGTKGVNIKSYYAAMGRGHLTRYQELCNFKTARKYGIKDYSEHIKYSITSLQNKSSSAIESTIHRISKSTTSSNDMDI